MTTTTSLPISALKPNDYNPNTMTEDGFAELVEEVRHLGHLPKPIVVRANGADEYVIVDGEHGWRAAKEVGLQEVAAEVVKVDDFEARRQTYKRNQHGEHDPVLLGRMFKQMMAERDLSQRQLAEEVSVSEGTIRNMLTYFDAWEVRNSYAEGVSLEAAEKAQKEISALSIRQVRTFLQLPSPICQFWLRDGADLKLLQEVVPKDAPKSIDAEELDWHVLIEAGLAKSLNRYHFRATRKLWGMFYWVKHQAIVGAWPYVVALAEHGWLGTAALDQLPVIETERPKKWPVWAPKKAFKIAIPEEEFQQVLGWVDKQEESSIGDLRDLLYAKAEAVLGNECDIQDPRVALATAKLEEAPDFLRNSSLELHEKAALWIDAPSQVGGWLAANGYEPADEDVNAAALVHAVECCENRKAQIEKIFSADSPSPSRSDAEMLLQLRRMTPLDYLTNYLTRHFSNTNLQAREELFADREALMSAVMDTMMKQHVVREEKTVGRPTHEVLRERLDALPWPEFQLLAAHITGHDSPAIGFWRKAVEAEEDGKS